MGRKRTIPGPPEDRARCGIDPADYIRVYGGEYYPADVFIGVGWGDDKFMGVELTPKKARKIAAALIRHAERAEDAANV